MQLQSDYFTAYHNLKLTRDDKGVLVAEFHTNGGPFIMTAQAHTEFVDAFYRISQDRANKIVILTGAGGEFITDVDWSSFGDVADPGVWSQVHDEGVQVLENIANIRVPVIAAIEGRAHVHSDYALLASVIVAADGATFQDVAHFSAGVAPGDGIFTTAQRGRVSRKIAAITGEITDIQIVDGYTETTMAMTGVGLGLLGFPAVQPRQLRCSPLGIASRRPRPGGGVAASTARSACHTRVLVAGLGSCGRVGFRDRFERRDGSSRPRSVGPGQQPLLCHPERRRPAAAAKSISTARPQPG